MRPGRILLLLVALIAGGLAAYLVVRGSGDAPVVEQAAVAPQQAPATQILVATAAIGVGQRLTGASVGWQPWPADAVNNQYITIAKSPDAPAKIAGAVARFEIFPGEPILDAKLVHSDQGFLSAVLAPGMRGVSIQVSAPSASGGFIIPNDRVDVILTSSGGAQSTSRVLLSNVKVLAIGTRLGQTGTTGAPADPDPKTQVFTSDAIATLELTPGQGDTLINATSLGKISLVLRSVADFVQTAATPDTAPADADTIKIIRYGRSASVTADGSGGGSAAPTVTPVAYTPPPDITPETTIVAPASPASGKTITTTGPNGATTVTTSGTTTTTVTTPPGATPVVMPN
jgi:pilus assembly protein CpaB